MQDATPAAGLGPTRPIARCRAAPLIEGERRDFLAPLDVKKAWPEQTEAAPTGEVVFIDGITGLPVSLDDLMDAL